MILDAVRAAVSEGAFAVVTSGEPDHLSSSVMWIDIIDGQLALNTRSRRPHAINLLAGRGAVVLILDLLDPYHYFRYDTRLAHARSGEFACNHIHLLSNRYRSEPYHEAEPRDRVVLILETIREQECRSRRSTSN